MIFIKRIFLIVLDSFGIGAMDDAKEFNDCGTNTLASVCNSKMLDIRNMKELGLFNIDGVNCAEKANEPLGSFARMTEVSKGKDTTIGHWEIAGIVTKEPFPIYPNGFPENLLKEFSKFSGREVICNKPYSGTEVIKDYGQEHMETGALIVYTSADSVFQIAAHEKIVPVEQLYRYCSIARSLLTGENAVGRVIARPFKGEYPNFTRTSHRHDFSLKPPAKTMLTQLKSNGKDVIAVGKINDIFSGEGITRAIKTKNNEEGIQKTLELTKTDFEGLCFTNLVDFDMLYGHRNDVDGYAKALTEFDRKLPKIIYNLHKDDILMITADHGCDPGYKNSTDHTREYVPLLVYGKNIKPGINLGTRKTFADIGATVLEYFGISSEIFGTSMLKEFKYANF